MHINLVKVFSSSPSESQDRPPLGDRVTEWLRQNPAVTVQRKMVTQSSDCVTITLLCKEHGL